VSSSFFVLNEDTNAFSLVKVQALKFRVFSQITISVTGTNWETRAKTGGLGRGEIEGVLRVRLYEKRIAFE
jgi:hypothetical protein